MRETLRKSLDRVEAAPGSAPAAARADHATVTRGEQVQSPELSAQSTLNDHEGTIAPATDTTTDAATTTNEHALQESYAATEKAPVPPPAYNAHGEELIDFLSLDYSLYHRRRRTKIALLFGLLIIESCVFPIAAFYGITYGKPDFPLQYTFAIITALCGTFSPIKFFLGAFRLYRKKTSERCRPLGQTRRLGFDFFHWSVTAGYTIFIIILIIGTAPASQITPLLAVAIPAFVLFMGTVLLLLQVMHQLNVRAPFRISSTPKGHRVPPAVYPYIEDIIAVEGSGNREYRQRLKARYDASPVFRRLLDHLGWFWIVGCFLAAVASAIVVGLTPWYIGYGFGWGIPFIWGFVWAVITIVWVSRELKKEKATWKATRRPPV